MGQDPKFKGRLIVVSGVSGAGKTTLTKMLLADLKDKKEPSLGGDETLHFSVSCTTRPARPGEIEGVDYFFVDEPEFVRRANNDQFLEWAHVHKRYYGTPKEAIFTVIEAGGTVLLDIDIQGFERIKNLRFDGESLPITSIFVVPPNKEELVKRLERRGPTDNLETRLGVAESEESFGRAHYDHILVNTTLDVSYPQYKEFVLGS